MSHTRNARRAWFIYEGARLAAYAAGGQIMTRGTLALLVTLLGCTDPYIVDAEDSGAAVAWSIHSALDACGTQGCYIQVPPGHHEIATPIVIAKNSVTVACASGGSVVPGGDGFVAGPGFAGDYMLEGSGGHWESFHMSLCDFDARPDPPTRGAISMAGMNHSSLNGVSVRLPAGSGLVGVEIYQPSASVGTWPITLRDVAVNCADGPGNIIHCGHTGLRLGNGERPANQVSVFGGSTLGLDTPVHVHRGGGNTFFGFGAEFFRECFHLGPGANYNTFVGARCESTVRPTDVCYAIDDGATGNSISWTGCLVTHHVTSGSAAALAANKFY